MAIKSEIKIALIVLIMTMAISSSTCKNERRNPQNKNNQICNIIDLRAYK